MTVNKCKEKCTKTKWGGKNLIFMFNVVKTPFCHTLLLSSVVTTIGNLRRPTEISQHFPFFFFFMFLEKCHINAVILTTWFWVKNFGPQLHLGIACNLDILTLSFSLICPLLQLFVIHWAATWQQLGVSALLKGTLMALNLDRGECYLFSSSNSNLS